MKNLSAKEITQRSKSNFSLSLSVLPKAQKQAVTVLYALARLVDDIVDEPGENKVEHLNYWRGEVRQAFEGKPESRLGGELAEVTVQFELTEKYFQELIDGVASDLTKSRFETFKELQTYCYGVAGTVGLICMEIFGLRHEKAKEYAVTLGEAFQLTNIIRDIKSDLDEGRVYIPQEDLQKFDCTEEDIKQGKKSEAFKNLVHFEAKRAHHCFERSNTLLSAKENRKVLAPKVMSAVYLDILEKIMQDPFQVLDHKVTLTKGRKISVALKALLASYLSKQR